MTGCFEDMDCGTIIERLDLPNKRNAIASVASGILFAVGWWIIIDASASYPDEKDFHHASHVVGVVSTLAFVMINAVSNSQVRGDAFYTGGCLGAYGARIWLFVGFLLSFCAFIAACWILLGIYVVPNNVPVTWPGFAIFLQNFFILLSSLIFKFGRSEELHQ